jgi:hypothetical protein
MKVTPPYLNLLLTLAWVLLGCQSPTVRSSGGAAAARANRKDGYSRLHQILLEQKEVRWLRFSPGESNAVDELAQRIAATCEAASKRLEAGARLEPVITLDALWLPLGDSGKRETIAAARQRELLGQTGGRFELTFLLTQAEALNYATHLAQVAGENERQPDRARTLAEVREELLNLHQAVVGLVRSRSNYPPRPRTQYQLEQPPLKLRTSPPGDLPVKNLRGVTNLDADHTQP